MVIKRLAPDMKLDSIMTKKVVTVEMDDTVALLREILHHVRFHHLPVIEDDELRGIISDRDILMVLSPFINTLSEQKRDLMTLEKRAHQIMTRKPITITKEASCEEATRLMLHEGISCLPVVSSGGRIEGIVTWRDLLRMYCGRVVRDECKENAKYPLRRPGG